jgi:cephalosporin-C deacetylase
VAHYDLTGDELRAFRSSTPEPAGFDDFWRATLDEARAVPVGVRTEPADTGYTLVDVHDVSFAGWNGERVRGWLTLPRGTDVPLPAVVEYVGYGGGRGLAHEPSVYALAGWAHLKMDTRGQGSGWSPGHTPDPDPHGGPQHPGFMTRGVLEPRTYYYRRVFADAVRAVEAVRALPDVDPARVAVAGGSQGGGISVAVGGLVPDLAAVLPDVPFLCDVRRATTLVDTYPYGEVAAYCRVHRNDVERVMTTLDHVDGVHHAARGRAPSLWSVALMDDICPPSTVYAAYNAWAGPKEIVEYRFNGHEGGQQFQDAERVRFLHRVFGTAP